MSTITDWLLVVITTVYVVATILICVFNYKSAKAAREQIKESQEARKQNEKIQSQNVGISLYEKRIAAIEKVSNDYYTKAVPEISLLFGAAFNDRINKLISIARDLRHLEYDEDQYYQYLKDEDHNKDLVRQLRIYESALSDYRTSEQDVKAYEDFCNEHTYTITDDNTGDTTVYNYPAIQSSKSDTENKLKQQKKLLMDDMQEFIRHSIFDA